MLPPLGPLVFTRSFHGPFLYQVACFLHSFLAPPRDSNPSFPSFSPCLQQTPSPRPLGRVSVFPLRSLFTPTAVCVLGKEKRRPQHPPVFSSLLTTKAVPWRVSHPSVVTNRQRRFKHCFNSLTVPLSQDPPHQQPLAHTPLPYPPNPSDSPSSPPQFLPEPPKYLHYPSLPRSALVARRGSCSPPVHLCPEPPLSPSSVHPPPPPQFTLGTQSK